MQPLQYILIKKYYVMTEITSIIRRQNNQLIRPRNDRAFGIRSKGLQMAIANILKDLKENMDTAGDCVGNPS